MTENIQQPEQIKNKINIDWPNLAAVCGVIATILGVLAISVGSTIYLGGKIDTGLSSMRQEMHAGFSEIKEEHKDFRERWAQESKDFHGRLERQDAEFKAAHLRMEEKYLQLKEKE